MAPGTRAVVQTKLLDQIDEGICGPEGYRIDAPYCDKQNRASVNLSSYSKIDSYKHPFSEPDQVAFCNDFKRWFYGFGDKESGVQPTTSCNSDESACLGASRNTLARISADCAQIEAEHQETKEVINKIIGALGAAGSYVIGRIAWALKNSEKAKAFFRAIFKSKDDFSGAKPKGIRGLIDWFFSAITRARSAAKGELTPEQISLETKANEIVSEKWPVIFNITKTLSTTLGVEHNLLASSPTGTAKEIFDALILPQTLTAYQTLLKNLESYISQISAENSVILSDKDLSPNDMIQKIRKNNDELEALQRQVSSLVKNLSDLLEALSSTFNVDPVTTTQWRNTMSSLASIKHDLARLVTKGNTSLNEASNLISQNSTSEQVIDYLHANYPIKLNQISDVVNLVAKLNHDRAARAGTKIVVNNNTPDRIIPAGLESVLYELISEPTLNAIKYTDPKLVETSGGVVIIDTRFDNEDLVFTISDNGPGITNPQEAIAGERLSPQTAYGHGGGLKSLMQLINREDLKQYDIRLDLITTAGKGSRIEVRVPKKHFPTSSKSQVSAWKSLAPVFENFARISGIDLETLYSDKPVENNAEIEAVFSSTESLNRFKDIVETTQDKILTFFYNTSRALNSDGNPEEIIEYIVTMIKEINEFSKASYDLTRALETIEENLNAEGGAGSIQLHEKWLQLMKASRSMFHDFNNVMTIYMGYLELSQTMTPAEAVKYLRERFGSLDTFQSMVKFVDQLYQSATAKGQSVNITLEVDSQMQSTKIPERIQLPLFRIINELVYNSLKYMDPDRIRMGKAFVKISLEQVGDQIIIKVEDNGVGIKNIESAKAGNREHPDLAAGHGIGLGGIYDLAKQYGFTLSHISVKTGGTLAEIRLNQSAIRELEGRRIIGVEFVGDKSEGEEASAQASKRRAKGARAGNAETTTRTTAETVEVAPIGTTTPAPTTIESLIKPPLK